MNAASPINGMKAKDGGSFLSTQLSNHPGTYAIIYLCATPVEAAVGKLGQVRLPIGYWIYVGSAFGLGGLRARVNHHLKSSSRPRPHWHLDYVKHDLRPLEIWTTMDGVKREHAWAAAFSVLKGASRPIVGFGASDCTCRAHLIHLPRRPDWSIFKRVIFEVIPAHGRLYRAKL